MAQEQEETLKRLGLSAIQAQVYLTLIRSGRSSAKTLSKHSNVARPDIYRIMAHFQQLGIAQKVITTPVMFEATPIEHALSGLVDNKVEEIRKVRKKTRNLIQELKHKQNHSTVGKVEPNLFLIPATKIALYKRKELIENAKSSINVISSWKHYKFLLNSNFNELTQKAIDRGVKFRLIIETPKKLKLPIEHHEALRILENNGSSLKFAEINPLNIISIYDNKEVLILMSEQVDSYDPPLLWSNNASIVSLANNYFENLWGNAKEESA